MCGMKDLGVPHQLICGVMALYERLPKEDLYFREFMTSLIKHGSQARIPTISNSIWTDYHEMSYYNEGEKERKRI